MQLVHTNAPANHDRVIIFSSVHEYSFPFLQELAMQWQIASAVMAVNVIDTFDRPSVTREPIKTSVISANFYSINTSVNSAELVAPSLDADFRDLWSVFVSPAQ